jgi:thioredoxin reductase (NADPH)
VYVVGGGNSAAQAALHFSRFAPRVTMLVREGSLKETVSQYLVDRIYSTSNIEVLLHAEVIAFDGDRALEEITVRNRLTGAELVFPTHRLFVCIGGCPRTDWAKAANVVVDPGGYLVTGADLMSDGRRPENWPLDRNPYHLETNVPGLFAAGDVRHGSVKRCASAVGEGAMALTFVHRYLTEG